MNQTLTDEKIGELAELVGKRLTGYRLTHTMGVVKEAARLGELYLPGEINRLRAAAWLHDITKQADCEKQLQFCREFGIILEPGEEEEYKLLHAKTGAALAEREFASYTDEEILGAIRWHTTGRVGMTVFESIIYLADYIEETRTYDDCIALRSYFWDRIRNGEDKTAVLTDAMIYSFDITVGALVKDGARIDHDTVRARNYFLTLKKKAQTN